MRLTDKRVLGDGFYQPKDKNERKEIILMDKPSYNDVYKKLGEYENTNVQPSEIENLGRLTFEKLTDNIVFGTEVVVYEDFTDPKLTIWSGFWERNMKKRKIFDDYAYNADVTSISVESNAIHIGICYAD